MYTIHCLPAPIDVVWRRANHAVPKNTNIVFWPPSLILCFITHSFVCEKMQRKKQGEKNEPEENDEKYTTELWLRLFYWLHLFALRKFSRIKMCNVFAAAIESSTSSSSYAKLLITDAHDICSEICECEYSLADLIRFMVSPFLSSVNIQRLSVEVLRTLFAGNLTTVGYISSIGIKFRNGEHSELCWNTQLTNSQY